MPSTKVELVRSIYAAWERGDFSSAEWADPEIEYVIADGPSPGHWTGLTGMTEGSRAYLSAWEDWRAEPEEYREIDGERLLVFTRYHGRGKRSGLEVEQMGGRGASLFHVRDGRVTRYVVYYDRERAFVDLGVAPEADPASS